MNQLPAPGENDGEQPTVTRGPINAAYPPQAPPQPANTFRLASFNVENYFPVGEINDGHTITQAEYDAKTNAIVNAIHDFLRDPDVVAVQEVAVLQRPQRADRARGGAGQLHAVHRVRTTTSAASRPASSSRTA